MNDNKTKGCQFVCMQITLAKYCNRDHMAMITYMRKRVTNKGNLYKLHAMQANGIHCMPLQVAWMQYMSLQATCTHCSPLHVTWIHCMPLQANGIHCMPL